MLSVEKKTATKRNGNKKKWAKEYEKGVRKVGQDDRTGSTGHNSRRKGREGGKRYIIYESRQDVSLTRTLRSCNDNDNK